MRKAKVYLASFLCISFLFASGIVRAGTFYREYWANWDPNINNCSGRLRVNDTELSLHEEFGRRSEARANGLALMKVEEDIFGLESAELYLEMWGGHPGTANKRFYLNGRQAYQVPETGTAAGNCTYGYPKIPLKVGHLVQGTNALQFVCDRGDSFWGHFILDNAAIRCFLKPNHPELIRSGMERFSAQVELADTSNSLNDMVRVSLSYQDQFKDSIRSVDYFGRYFGFDDDGDGRDNGWHGYTQKRLPRNHIGTSSTAPFEVVWDTTMVPSQSGAMAIRAVVHLKNGLKYVTDTLDGLSFDAGRDRVEMYKCSEMPAPFWSRASRVSKATINLPEDVGVIRRALLMVKIWDGGEGNVKEPFRINGIPYSITSGKAIHDVVFTIAGIDPSNLRGGDNEITLVSDTEHHGIEVLLPGPVLIVRYGRR